MNTTYRLLTAALPLLALLASVARAVEPASHPAGQITDETVLFDFRGRSIKAGDLPGHSLTCRMYVADKKGQSFASAMHFEYGGKGSFYNPIKFLSRLTFEVRFAQDWTSADVFAQSDNFVFKPLRFGSHSGLTATHEYDRLKAIDPERSSDSYFRELARKALKKKWTSGITELHNLQLTFGRVPNAQATDPAVPGHSIHIFDRQSKPKFYLRISETKDQVNDEWLPQLFGDLEYLKGGVLPKFGESHLKEAVMITTGITIIPLLFLTDWSSSAGIDVGAYCYPGAPAALDIYELKPLGRASHLP